MGGCEAVPEPPPRAGPPVSPQGARGPGLRQRPVTRLGSRPARFGARSRGMARCVIVFRVLAPSSFVSETPEDKGVVVCLLFNLFYLSCFFEALRRGWFYVLPVSELTFSGGS